MFYTYVLNLFKNSKFYLYLSMGIISIFIISILVFQDDIRSFFHVETKQSLAVALSKQKDEQQKVIQSNQSLVDSFNKMDAINNISTNSLISLNKENNKVNTKDQELIDSFNNQINLNNAISKTVISKPITSDKSNTNTIKHSKPIKKEVTISKDKKQAQIVINALWESYCDGLSNTCSK